MNDKYELLEKDEETGLFRIRALRDIPEAGVKAGDLGGFVAGEGNLSQEDGAWVADKARVYDSARVYEYAQIYGGARVYEYAWIYGGAEIYGNAEIRGYAWIYGDARVFGQAQISGFARVCKNGHFLCLGPIGSRSDYTTFYRTDGDGVGVSCGCFRGTLDEFAAKVEETHKDNPVRLAEYRAAIELFRAVREARARKGAYAGVSSDVKGGVNDAGS